VIPTAPATPPAMPQSLSPGTTDRTQAPDLLSCERSTPLTWQAGEGATPTGYHLILQYLTDEQEWVTVVDSTVMPPVDISPSLKQYQNYWWRWTVQAIDAEGQQSTAAPWHYLTCFDFH